MATVVRSNMDDVEISELDSNILMDIVYACKKRKKKGIHKSFVVSIDRIKKYSSDEITDFIDVMTNTGILHCYQSNGVLVVTGHWDFFIDGEYISDNRMGSLHQSGGRFYVYICYHNDVPVYIGKGTGDRIKHCTSGKSNCVGLNEIYYKDGASSLRTEKILDNLCNQTALAHEKTVIRSMQIAGVKLLNKC